MKSPGWNHKGREIFVLFQSWKPEWVGRQHLAAEGPQKLGGPVPSCPKHHLDGLTTLSQEDSCLRFY